MTKKTSVEDVGGHSSTPPSSTAIGILASAITKIENNPFPLRLRDSPASRVRRFSLSLSLSLFIWKLEDWERFESHFLCPFSFFPFPKTFEWIAPELSLPHRIMLSNLWLFEPIVSYALSSSRSMRATIQTTAAVTIIEGPLPTLSMIPYPLSFADGVGGRKQEERNRMFCRQGPEHFWTHAFSMETL